MVRLLVFFVAVFLLTGILAQVPVVGAAFRIPFLGFWFTAILLSLVLAKVGTEAVDARARRSLERSLGSVDTPHHKGKLASLYLSQGRAKKAVPLFEEAVSGDPTSLEWRFRLGEARLAAGGDPSEALDDLDAVVGADEEYAFGKAMLASADAARRLGRFEDALTRVERFERNHGPSPASALERGRALKGLGRTEDARRAFGEVGPLAKAAPARVASRSWTWSLRAFFARVFG
ncbi:MAG: tetratricopeptide repeat protein [Planctomycetota bacterium]